MRTAKSPAKRSAAAKELAATSPATGRGPSRGRKKAASPPPPEPTSPTTDTIQ
jgi:hypothetical protein